ncbi:type I polyketide synthase [Streptomyces sp. GKU 257-1]|nr:type I polyketide synthase [Streptomyces sp. GKU 257-1]
MVLALRHGELPATLHAEEPSPHIDWASGGLELLDRAVPWPSADRPRRAGISSFGISGTNAHLVLEQPPRAEPSPPNPQRPGPGHPVVLALSGRTEQALRDQAARLHTELAARTDWRPADVAHSLLTTRTRFRQRAARHRYRPGRAAARPDRRRRGHRRPLRRPGQRHRGPPSRPRLRRPGRAVGRHGARTPRHDTALRRLDRPLRARPGPPCGLEPDRSAARGEPGQPGLDRVDVVQPVLFATMVALAELWRTHGVEPAAVVGNSQGEIAAACTAGALTLDDAALIVARRSQALVALAGRGAMASVALPTDRVRALLSPWGERVSVAVRNGPGATTVSGEPEAVAEVVERCVADGVRAKLVAVDYASHSARWPSWRSGCAPTWPTSARPPPAFR